MKFLTVSAAGRRRNSLACSAAVLVAFTCTLVAAPMESGRLTRTVRSVKVGPPEGKARTATTNQEVPNGTAIRTGADARAELTFSNKVITRLGGKTILRVNNGTRELQLEDGAVLFHAPKSARRARITSAAINASITGTTGLFERNGTAYFKFLVLEGTARVYVRKLGESVLVSAGEMLIGKPDATVLPEPVHFSIEHLYRTSLLTQGGFAQLASHNAIQEAIRRQKNDRRFHETNLVIYGRGTLVNLLPPSPTPAPKTRSSPAAETGPQP